jgi:ankyrin repeat protein
MKYLEHSHPSVYLFFRTAGLGEIMAILKILLQSGLNPNDPKFIDVCLDQEGACPHMWVLHENWRNIIPPFEPFNLLLDYGANAIDHRMKDGRTALTRACANGSLDVVQLLLNRHADVDFETPVGLPLQIAVRFNKLDIVQCLVQHGARLDATSAVCEQPLILAAMKGFIEVAKYLIENGADIDCRAPSVRNSSNNQETGLTPLMTAAKNGHVEVVRYILEVNSAFIFLYTVANIELGPQR